MALTPAVRPKIIKKRTKKFIRDARGTTVLSAQDTRIIKIYMPYDR